MSRNGFIASLVALMLLIIGVSIALTVHKSANVTLVMSPSAAKLKLDNTKMITATSFYASPGKHSLTASFTGFATHTQSFTVTKGQTATVTVLLQPNSAAGQQYLQNHLDEQSKRQAIVGQAFDTSTQQRINKLPLIKKLPYIERYFRLDSGPSKAHPDDNTAVAVYVTFYVAVGKQQALDWIQQQGYNPADLEIVYVDQTATTQNE